MSTARPLIAGNWKMNGLARSLDEARALAAALDSQPPACRVALCPPATLVHRMAEVLGGTGVEIGGQDCRAESNGAFTGDISAEMLTDAGAALVILGHSERRTGYGETDQQVRAKAVAAMAAGLEPIICVGETLGQREAGEALAVVTAQVRGSLPDDIAAKAFAVAYEPVWAIGTGLTPTLEQIEEVHMAIRATLVELFGAAGAAPPILYGGSVKPSNAGDILKVTDVGGALVGGASLKAEDFLGIITAA
jgi:triosephosphate isomerase (TIM)